MNDHSNEWEKQQESSRDDRHPVLNSKFSQERDTGNRLLPGDDYWSRKTSEPQILWRKQIFPLTLSLYLSLSYLCLLFCRTAPGKTFAIFDFWRQTNTLHVRHTFSFTPSLLPPFKETRIQFLFSYSFHPPPPLSLSLTFSPFSIRWKKFSKWFLTKHWNNATKYETFLKNNHNNNQQTT